MYRIISINKSTREEKTLDIVETECKAERFCELWGWTYDDGACSYWLEYEEV